MNTVRSCLATTVAFLVVAIGWWAADAVVCCKSSSVATVGEDVIASCQNKNRTFHMVEAIGGGTCDDNRTAVPVRKCCPLGQTYDLSLDFCKPAELDGDAQSRRMMQKLRDVSRELDDAVMVGYNYGQPLCDAGYVLIDLPIKELLMESYRSGFGFLPGSCFDLTPSDELVALTCRTRDLYCGRGRYKCVPKCCKHNQMIVDAPNGPQCKQIMQSFKKYTYEKYYMLKEKNETLLPYHVEFSCLHGGINRQWFILATDGRLHFVFDYLFIPDTEYCVDYSPVDNKIVALVCNDDPMFVITRPGNSIPLFYRASYVASVVCLALTLLVYNTLPSLRNVSSYYVKCYVGHQLVSHVCGIVQMSMKNIKGDACLIFGYITLFVFLSTLCWLNVIFFDLNWVIRCNMSTNRSTSTSIRTIMYHVYCWGISSIIVCTGFFSNQVRLSMSMYGCLFFHKAGFGHLLFILIPVSIMLTANLILLWKIIIHYSRIKNGLNTLNRTDSKIERFLVYRERFVISIKLFLIMAIPYFFSILSIFTYVRGIKWYIIYGASSLQGVLIFIIFVAKRNVIMDLRKKFNGFNGSQ